jgi:hypothetical protein
VLINSLHACLTNKNTYTCTSPEVFCKGGTALSRGHTGLYLIISRVHRKCNSAHANMCKSSSCSRPFCHRCLASANERPMKLPWRHSHLCECAVPTSQARPDHLTVNPHILSAHLWRWALASLPARQRQRARRHIAAAITAPTPPPPRQRRHRRDNAASAAVADGACTSFAESAGASAVDASSSCSDAPAGQPQKHATMITDGRVMGRIHSPEKSKDTALDEPCALTWPA